MYIILEAHHRFDDPAAADLWSLIRQVYAVHPEAKTAAERPEIAAVARITVAARQKYDAHIIQQQRATGTVTTDAREPTGWIAELCQNFGLPQVNTATADDSDAFQFAAMESSDLLPADFDFDMIDWSIWEETRMNA